MEVLGKEKGAQGLEVGNAKYMLNKRPSPLKALNFALHQKSESIAGADGL